MRSPRVIVLAGVLAGALAAGPCTLPVTLANATASTCACGTQGAPATCTYPPGQSPTVGTNFVNPCVDHWTLLRISTGYEKALLDPRVAGPWTGPTPTTFCFNYYCGPNAQIVQTFKANCGAGYFGAPNAVTATCTASANCWYSGNFGSLRGALIYNTGPNSSSSTLSGTASTPGPCTANVYTTSTAQYVGFDSTSGNSVSPYFAYSLAGCTPCPAGTYGAPNASSSAQCAPCPASTFSPPGSAACAPCVAGTYGNATSKACAACPVGTYSGAAATACTACPAGVTSAAGGGNSAAVCTLCVKGYGGAIANSGTATASGCAPCAAGTYALTVNGTSSCVACAANTISAAASTSCTACPAGTSSPAGGTVCIAPTPSPSPTPTGTPTVTPSKTRTALPTPTATPATTPPAGSASPARSPAASASPSSNGLAAVAGGGGGTAASGAGASVVGIAVGCSVAIAIGAAAAFAYATRRGKPGADAAVVRKGQGPSRTSDDDVVLGGTVLQGAQKVAAARKSAFMLCEDTASGKVWYASLETGETVWALPPGGIVTKKMVR